MAENERLKQLRTNLADATADRKEAFESQERKNVMIPASIAVAMQARRPELMRVVKPESLTPEGIQGCLDLIATFIDSTRGVETIQREAVSLLADLIEVVNSIEDAPLRDAVYMLRAVKPLLTGIRQLLTEEP